MTKRQHPRMPRDIIEERILCQDCEQMRVFPYCAAFPTGEGIPMGIIRGTLDHRRPIRGDHGIRFEQGLLRTTPP